MKKIFTLIFALGLFAMANATEFTRNRTRSLMTAPIRVERYAVIENHPNNVVNAEAVDQALTFDYVEIAWYPSFSSEGSYNYSIALANTEGGEYSLPQGIFDIYTTEYMGFAGTYTTADGSMDLTYGGLYIAKGTGYEQVTVSSATCTITETENAITFKGKFVKNKTLSYTFDLTAAFEDVIYYDAEHEYEPMKPQEVEFTPSAAPIIDMDDAATDSLIYIQFVSTEGNAMLLEYYHTDEKATEMPNGTFEITGGKKGSFLEGFWSGKNKAPYPSYAIQKVVIEEKEGAYVYYLVEGTITVSGNGNENKSFDVDVTSFYGTNIKFKYTADPQGIENTTVDTKATKVVRDGQIYIIRDGKMFNAIGTQVK